MNFKNNLGNGKVLVDFYTDTCGPCKRMLPIVDKIAKTYKVIKIDAIDEVNREIVETYGISSVPTFMVFIDGEPVQKYVGVVTEEKLLEALEG